MRVAIILTSFPEPSTTFILNQITGLIDRGHEVDIYGDRLGSVCAMHPDVDRYRLLERTLYPSMPRSFARRAAKGLRLVAGALLDSPIATLRSLRLLHSSYLPTSLVQLYGQALHLGRRSYDIIHCHFGPNGLKGLFLRDSARIAGKLVVTFHGYDVMTYPRTYGVRVYRPLFKTGDCYTANTRFTANRAVDLGCPGDKIVILPMGVNLTRLSFSERQRNVDEPVRVLTVGRLVEVKGVEYGIRTVARVAGSHPEIRYQIVGDGELRRPLEALAQRLGIPGRVEFLGVQPYDRLVELYKAAHIFMLPGVITRNGTQEGQGLVLAEAQAMGLPVLATRVGGVPETVLDGRSGFLVPQRDVDALAERLSYLIERPESWPEMGRVGRAHVERNYDYEKLNDRLVEIYEGLLRST